MRRPMVRSGGDGSTLPEVLAALLLLAGTLLSSAGLSIQAQRGIRAGGRDSLALAAARSVLERLALSSLRQAYSFHGCDLQSAVCTGDAGTPEGDDGPPPFDPALGRTSAELRFDALDAPTLGEASAVRVTLTLAWQAGGRAGRLRLMTVRE